MGFLHQRRVSRYERSFCFSSYLPAYRPVGEVAPPCESATVASLAIFVVINIVSRTLPTVSTSPHPFLHVTHFCPSAFFPLLYFYRYPFLYHLLLPSAQLYPLCCLTLCSSSRMMGGKRVRQCVFLLFSLTHTASYSTTR